MEMTQLANTRLLLVMAILWLVGCSLNQPAGDEYMPPTTPDTRAIEQAPAGQPQQVRIQVPPEVKYYNHRIKWSGESLSLIAHWYTGDEKNWKRLVEANPGIKPRRIKIGDSILIPEDLLIRRRPMPIEYLAPATDKKKEPPPPAKQAVKPDKIELFGPIDTEAQKSDVNDSESPLPLETIE